MTYLKYDSYTILNDSIVNEIPSHWNIGRMGRELRRIKLTGFENEDLLSVYRDYGVIPKSSRDDNYNKASDDLSSYQLVLPGNLVINKMKAWQGSLGVSKYRGICSPAYHTYTKKHIGSFDDDYLHYLLRSDLYIHQYLKYSKGIRVNQWDLDPDSFTQIPLIKPPLIEQKSIAKFLNQKISEIDYQIKIQEKFIKILTEKKQAVISLAVFRGLNPLSEMKDSNIEWIGRVPCHWLIKKFTQCVSIRNGLVDPKDEVFLDMVLIAPNHIEKETGRILNYETVREQSADSNKYLVRNGEIIYSKIRPSLAKATLSPLELCLCSADMYPLKPLKGIDAEYFLYLLLSKEFTQKTVLDSERVAMPKVNRETLSQYRIPVPPESEQAAIVTFIKKSLSEIDLILGKAESLNHSLKEKKSSLISNAVTGKIKVI